MEPSSILHTIVLLSSNKKGIFFLFFTGRNMERFHRHPTKKRKKLASVHWCWSHWTCSPKTDTSGNGSCRYVKTKFTFYLIAQAFCVIENGELAKQLPELSVVKNTLQSVAETCRNIPQLSLIWLANVNNPAGDGDVERNYLHISLQGYTMGCNDVTIRRPNFTSGPLPLNDN